MLKSIMKRSKKGITLVELIISVAVSAMVIMAAYGLMYSAQVSYASSTKLLNNHLEASNLQTVLELNLPTVSRVDWEDSLPTDRRGIFALNFSDSTLHITNGENTSYTLDDVESFAFSFKKLGESESARAHFTYTVMMSNGTQFSGGITLQNLNYDSLSYFTTEIVMNSAQNSNYLIFHRNSVETTAP